MPELLAQAEPYVGAIAQYGLTPAIIGWFMLRAESKLARIDSAISLFTQSFLLYITNHAANETVATQARDLKAELDKHLACK